MFLISTEVVSTGSAIWLLHLGASSVYTMQPCTSLQCHLIPSHICRMHVCLGVACHLHFWQNVQGLLHATVVTQRWNRYWNESQHRKLTLDWLEKKILLPLMLGLKPATFWSQSWTCVSCWPYLKHDWATFLPTSQTLNETIRAPPVPFSIRLCHTLTISDVPFLQRLRETILAPPVPFSVELASWKCSVAQPTTYTAFSDSLKVCFNSDNNNWDISVVLCNWCNSLIAP